MNKTRRRAVALTILLGVLSGGHVFAGGNELQPKSVALATVLALDPIPGDALLYAGKPAEGGINMILGGVSGAFFYFFLAMYITEPGPDPSCSDMSCSGMGKGLAGLFAGLTAIPYFSCLLWDGIGGIHGVVKYNAEIEKKRKTSWLSTVRPTVAVTANGAFAGAQFTF